MPATSTTPALVERALAFIDTHPDSDIGIAEIAAAAGTGPRTLQQAFRTHLGTTPISYLRRTRLACAHHDLLHADPDSQTVTAIARRWRFAHLGRFAETYRLVYGHHPSHTLRQSGADPQHPPRADAARPEDVRYPTGARVRAGRLRS